LLNVFLLLLLTSKIPSRQNRSSGRERHRVLPRADSPPLSPWRFQAIAKWPVPSSRLAPDPPRNPHKFRRPDNLSAIVGPIDPTSSDDALAKNVGPGWSRWHLPWRLAAPRRRSFRYKLDAPVEAVIEQESSAAVNVKVIPTRRVVHGRPDPTELLA
jgi:hypothetical protein